MTINYSKEKINGRIIYKYDSRDIVKFKELANILLKSSNIKLPSRNIIISNIICCMSNNLKVHDRPIVCSPNVKIIRGDVHDFFPSVNDHKLLRLVRERFTLSYSELKLLREILSDTSVKGLPQGNPVSSVLAEIYLDEFDKKVINKLSPLYYARFVDDFIIIVPLDELNRINYKQFLTDELEKMNLLLSESKYADTDFNQESPSFSFDFLGYHFEPKPFDSKKNVLRLSVAQPKVKKIISRINRIYSIFSSSRKTNRDFLCLYYRLEFLLKGVRTVDYRGSYKLSGIPFTYGYINDFQNLKAIQSRIMTLCRIQKLSNRQQKALFGLSTAYNQKDKSSFSQSDYVDYVSMSTKKFNSLYASLSLKKMKTKKRSIAEFSVLINNLK